jgi:hypothetical protein
MNAGRSSAFAWHPHGVRMRSKSRTSEVFPFPSPATQPDTDPVTMFPPSGVPLWPVPRELIMNGALPSCSAPPETGRYCNHTAGVPMIQLLWGWAGEVEMSEDPSLNLLVCLAVLR